MSGQHWVAVIGEQPSGSGGELLQNHVPLEKHANTCTRCVWFLSHGNTVAQNRAMFLAKNKVELVD